MLKKQSQKKKIGPLYTLMFIVLSLYAILMFVLVLWAIVTSLKFQSDFRTNVLGLPSGHIWTWAWSNFPLVFENFSVTVLAGGTMSIIGFWQMLLYTILYAGVGALISGIVPCFVAYVTVKCDFRFNNILYGIVIVTLALPIVGAAPSEIQVLRQLGLYNTIWGTWVQKFHFLGMYYLVFCAAFKSISNEYMEAAYMDGAGDWQVLLRIMLPLVRNTLFTVILIRFIDYWNDYQTPLLYIPSYPTLAVGVYNLGYTTVGVMSYVPMRMAACIILLVPIFVLFLLFRNRLMGNLSMGGIKE